MTIKIIPNKYSLFQQKLIYYFKNAMKHKATFVIFSLDKDSLSILGSSKLPYKRINYENSNLFEMTIDNYIYFMIKNNISIEIKDKE